MRQKRISAVCLALAMGTGLGAGTGTALPLTALAGSPEFAYTAEKWASLRDDKLEFGEIADLVPSYRRHFCPLTFHFIRPPPRQDPARPFTAQS